MLPPESSQFESLTKMASTRIIVAMTHLRTIFSTLCASMVGYRLVVRNRASRVVLTVMPDGIPGISSNEDRLLVSAS